MATRVDKETRRQSHGTRGQGLSGEEFPRTQPQEWRFPPSEVTENIPPDASYKDFVRRTNSHINGLNDWLKDELDKIWDKLQWLEQQL